MKRKVILHGPSTLIVSLPSKWVSKNGVKKGDEVEVSEKGDSLILTNGRPNIVSRYELDISDYGEMTARTIHALYKKGADELILRYDDPKVLGQIQDALGKEAIGFEILETTKGSCLIKNVAEGTKEFDPVLRQTFLMLLSMAEDGYKAIKYGDGETLMTLVSLERANNRFTTFCRRHINTKGASNMQNIGSLYYLVEQLEKIADTMKYLYTYLGSVRRIEVKKELLDIFQEACVMLRNSYQIYYSFSPKKLAELKRQRDELIKQLYAAAISINKPQDIIFHQHMLVFVTDVFSLNGPMIVLNINPAENS
jgi:phosphate uptake regulator